MFNAFLSTCAVAFRKNHWQNNTNKFDTEDVVPVASLNGVVGLPSSFIKYLIGRTGKIWSVVYIDKKWIHASETLACTIREWAIVRNNLHVTSTCLFIYWCSGTSNIKLTPRVWHSSLNSVKVNCDLEYAEIISNSHHPNSSIFQNLDWNISRLSIFSYVEIFSMPQSFGILE